MKKSIILLLVFYFGVNCVCAQSKKEMIQNVSQLESTVENLKSAVESLKSTVKLANETNSLLENKLNFVEGVVKSQTDDIKQLQKELTDLKNKQVAADPMAVITDPQNEEDSIISIVQQYYGAKKWEDRLSFVNNPDQVKQLMQKYYNGTYRRTVVDKNKISIPGNGYKIDDKFIVTTDKQSLYMLKTKENFKVDWMATIGYNEENLSNYAARKGTNKIIERIEIFSLREGYDISSNYYETYIGASCYFQKTSSVGQRISQMMNSGGRVRITVEAQGMMKKDKYGDERYFIFINKIIKEDWFSE